MFYQIYIKFPLPRHVENLVGLPEHVKNFEHLNKSRWILSVPVDILEVPEGILLVCASGMFLDFRNTKLAMKDDFTRKFVQQQKSPNGYCFPCQV